MEKIIIASDHAGFALKEKLKAYLRKRKIQVQVAGAFSRERCDYPDHAAMLARAISKGTFKRGILICKSGIGNSIVANRFSGVRAALCYSVAAARLSRKHNDSNVLVLGSSFVSNVTAQRMLSVWLRTEFEGGRHQKRLMKIKKIEQEIGAGKYEKLTHC